MLAHLKARPIELVIFVVFFRRLLLEKITKITLILCVLALVGCGANVFCAGPRGLPSPFSCLVSELWPIPPDRLVGAPTDDGDLHHARGAWERPTLVVVHALASQS